MIFNGDATNKNMMSVYLNMAALFTTDGENDDEYDEWLDSRLLYSWVSPRKMTCLHVVALPDLLFVKRL